MQASNFRPKGRSFASVEKKPGYGPEGPSRSIVTWLATRYTTAHSVVYIGGLSTVVELESLRIFPGNVLVFVSDVSVLLTSLQYKVNE